MRREKWIRRGCGPGEKATSCALYSIAPWVDGDDEIGQAGDGGKNATAIQTEKDDDQVAQVNREKKGAVWSMREPGEEEGQADRM